MADEEDYSNQSGVCKIYDKDDFFTVVVQIFLALVAVGSLYWKRLQERPRRKFLIWFLDVSKQALGAGYAHVLNMVIASLISIYHEGSGDQCAWYGISFLIDTTLGLLLALVGLQVLNAAAKRFNWTALVNSGVYTGDTALCHWTAQVFSWISILTITKIFISIFMWICREPLDFVGKLALTMPFNGHPRLELIFVMVLFPGVLNIIYFWIADSYLKATPEHSAVHEVDEEKQEAFLSKENEAEEEKTTEMQAQTTPGRSIFGS